VDFTNKLQHLKKSLGMIVDRKEYRQKAELESKQNDMKQHADKLIQGFSKLDASHAKRAIWELFQNALDLCENADIEIRLTENSLIFRHNGKPFDHNTLNCLIKQVSSKSAESNEVEVGQYGTGFITTHSFGRKILISGSLQQENSYITLEKFEIDRTAKTSPELINALVKQQDDVFDLIEKGQLLELKSKFTEFAYLTESDLQKDYANSALMLIPLILPYVMVLNKKLQKVTIVDKANKTTVYQKLTTKPVQERNIIETSILINSIIEKIYTIEDSEESITIILPLKDTKTAFLFDEQLSKLFLFYPLIGTENFGFNFLIHSTKFTPTEQRDSIHLKSTTEQIQVNEEANRRLMTKSSELIFDFVYNNSSEIANPIYLAKINFVVNDSEQLKNEYFQELKTTWIDKYKTYSIVETEYGNIQVSKSAFLHLELLHDETAFNSIYNLISKFWKNIPLKQLTRDWTQLVDEWNIESINYVRISDLVVEIERLTLEECNESDLQIFYAYLIKQEKGDYFNKHRLLPNIKGEFRKLNELNLSVNMNSVLIEIADVILPEIAKRHIHPNFKFDFTFTPYSRKNYSTELNEQIGKLILDNPKESNIEEEQLSAILDYCKINSTEDSSSVPINLMKLSCINYHKDTDLVIIPTIKDDELDIRPAQKKILRLLFNDLSNKDSFWVSNNIDFIKELLSTGSSYYDYEDLFLTSFIYPNQQDELCLQGQLKIDDNITEEIKDLYDKIVKPKDAIRSVLLNPMFASYIKNKENKKNNKNLADEIETAFSYDGQYSNFDEHPFKNDILDIVKKATKSEEWRILFPHINSQKANIILKTVTDENIKDNVFSIVQLGVDKINQLGELAKDENFDKIMELKELVKLENFDKIISLGKEALITEEQKKADFTHKYTIGTHVEQILRNGLTDIIGKEIEAEIIDIQNGQDIIIKIEGEPIFYLEVKSKWDVNNPIRMSKNQTIKAFEQKNNYALCSINMTKYSGINKYNIIDITEITELIRFNTDIGEKVEHLIPRFAELSEVDKFRLDGDYRTYIPQNYVDNGMLLKEFESFLIKFLKESYAVVN
jgi:hypothetical protein